MDKLKLKAWAVKLLEWFRKWLFLGSVLAEPTKVHYIKCEKDFFNDVVEGYKSFEIRKNDRDYQAGDDIVLREYDKEAAELTGRELRVSIIYFLDDYPGIEQGYCILGIEEY